MPWLRNNEIVFSSETCSILAAATMRTKTTLYRSRNAIDDQLFRKITVPFRIQDMFTTSNNPNVQTRFYTYAMPRAGVTAETIERIQNTVSDAVNNYSTSRNVLLYNTNGNNADTPTVVQQLIDGSGWEEVSARTALTITPNHVVHVLVKDRGTNPKAVLIFTNILSDELILKLGAVLPGVYNTPISDALVQAYLTCDKALFEAALFEVGKEVRELAAAELLRHQQEEEEIERARREEKLNKLADYLSTFELYNTNQELIQCERLVLNREEELRNLYSTLKDIRIKKASTEWGVALSQAATEFVDYIKLADSENIKRFELRSAESRLEVGLTTVLRYWEDRLYMNYVNSPNSNCVTRSSPAARELLNSIFVYKTVEVVFLTGINIYLKDNNVQKNTNLVTYNSSTIGMPHPHIHYYNCWGNNSSKIEKALSQRQYIIAWEQIRSALQGLNLADTTVFEKFTSQINSNDNMLKCIRILSTGEVLTVTEFKRLYPQGINNTTEVVAETEAEATIVMAPPIPPTVRNPEPGDDDDYEAEEA